MSSSDANPLTGERYDHPELGAFQREFKINREAEHSQIFMFGAMTFLSTCLFFWEVYRLTTTGHAQWLLLGAWLFFAIIFLKALHFLRPTLLSVATYEHGFLSREAGGTTIYPWNDMVRIKEYTVQYNDREVPHLLFETQESAYVLTEISIYEYEEFLKFVRERAEQQNIEWLDLGVKDESEMSS